MLHKLYLTIYLNTFYLDGFRHSLQNFCCHLSIKDPDSELVQAEFQKKFKIVRMKHCLQVI